MLQDYGSRVVRKQENRHVGKQKSSFWLCLNKPKKHHDYVKNVLFTTGRFGDTHTHTHTHFESPEVVVHICVFSREEARRLGGVTEHAL